MELGDAFGLSLIGDRPMVAPKGAHMSQRTQRPVIAPTALVVAALLAFPMICGASADSGFIMEILVDGASANEYHARGTTYIEAHRNAEYAIRLRNTTGRRIAVALAVDGLNSIDAKTTTARQAAKWIVGPYETVVIEGWQTNQQHARKFFFTTEESSYGAWLGETSNLGVIEAVVFRERLNRDEIAGSDARLRRQSSAKSPMPVPEPQPGKPSSTDAEAARPSDDLAATGIGRQVDNPVRRVRLDLEPNPSAHLRVRYEYRPQLVALGVLPPISDPLRRREQARGFDDFDFCPDPNAGR